MPSPPAQCPPRGPRPHPRAFQGQPRRLLVLRPDTGNFAESGKLVFAGRKPQSPSRHFRASCPLRKVCQRRTTSMAYLRNGNGQTPVFGRFVMNSRRFLAGRVVPKWRTPPSGSCSKIAKVPWKTCSTRERATGGQRPMNCPNAPCLPPWGHAVRRRRPKPSMGHAAKRPRQHHFAKVPLAHPPQRRSSSQPYQ